MSLLTKFASESIEENISPVPQVLSAIQQFSRAKEDNIDGPIMNKKLYKLADKELLVRMHQLINFHLKFFTIE